jgi:hypothetical protein
MVDRAIIEYPMGYRGLVLNEHRNTDGSIDVSQQKDTIIVDRFDFSPILFRDQRDGLHLMYGGDLGVVSSEFRFVNVQGSIAGSTWAALEDRLAKLNAAFHPENAVWDNPSTRGIDLFDFYSPTEESGYVSPVRECFFGRPTGIPQTFEQRAPSRSRRFAVELICTPPGRYLYTAESRTANAGNSWIVTLPNWTEAQGYGVSPILTLVLTGAGSNGCTIWYRLNDDTTIIAALVLDLSGLGVGAHTIVVDVGNGTIREGSTRKDNLRTSAVDTGVWQLQPGGGKLLVVSGRTNLTSVTATYRQARA